MKQVSSIEHGGYQCNSHFHGSVGPLECICMAPLALFNEGVRAHFFLPYGGTHDEAPECKNIALSVL